MNDETTVGARYLADDVDRAIDFYSGSRPAR